MSLPVLLVHGLGRTPLSLLRLGRRLARAGASPHYFGYYAWAESHPRILDRLSARLGQLGAAGAPVGLIGHSLGGLLLRQAVFRVPGFRVHHLVMLGTPNNLPRLAPRARNWMAFRLLTRSCGELLADPAAFRLPPPAYPCTVIAGASGRRGRWSPFGNDPNDGFVAVDEARLPGNDPILLPVRHTFMMNQRAVQTAVLESLGLQ